MFRYRNTKTGQVIESETERAVFGRSSQWAQLADGDDTPPSGSTESDGVIADQGGTNNNPFDVDLDKLTREDLDREARHAGIVEPENLPNKGAVKAAIKAKRAEADGDDTPPADGEDGGSEGDESDE